MSDSGNPSIDTGTAYGMKPRAYRTELVETGPGTPMGELLRRFWQPCYLSDALTSDKPQRVKILGENLVLFRDKQGRPGLVHENCCHRGTSLYFGRIEEDGIRCCYHGWKFDVQGRCLVQPAEVDGGRNREKVRQPWYPVEERYGLVYAYMGPPEKKPALPRWAHLENLADDEYIEATTRNPYGPLSGGPLNPLDYNWLQAFENTMDVPHLPWLHYWHSTDQFTGSTLMAIEDANIQHPPYAQIKDAAGDMVFERTDLGVKSGLPIPIPGKGTFMASNEAILPNIAVVTDFIDLLQFVPCDDTSHIIYYLFRSKKGQSRADMSEQHAGKTWWDMTEEEHRASPGDYEAQSSIGALPAHNLEHLTPGDAAVGLLRRRLADAVRAVQDGNNPVSPLLGGDNQALCINAHGVRPITVAA